MKCSECYKIAFHKSVKTVYYNSTQLYTNGYFDSDFERRFGERVISASFKDLDRVVRLFRMLQMMLMR